MFFSFNGAIAWSLFVTEGYFCEEIIGIVIVRCRAPRRDKETTAFAFTEYPRSAVFDASIGHNFCPLTEGYCWEEQTQTQTCRKTIFSIQKCEMFFGNKAQIKLFPHNINPMKSLRQ